MLQISTSAVLVVVFLLLESALLWLVKITLSDADVFVLALVNWIFRIGTVAVFLLFIAGVVMTMVRMLLGTNND